MEKQIIFNHIPKTDGTTLRIILNRVYKPEQVYFLKSTKIGESVENFLKLHQSGRERYRVIAGHAACMLNEIIQKPFTVTILREAVSLFFFAVSISQRKSQLNIQG